MLSEVNENLRGVMGDLDLLRISVTPLTLAPLGLDSGLGRLICHTLMHIRVVSELQGLLEVLNYLGT